MIYISRNPSKWTDIELQLPNDIFDNDNDVFEYIEQFLKEKYKVRPSKKYKKDENNFKPLSYPEIKKVRFHDPATVVWFEDGSKTVAVAGHGDKYDKEVGLGICILKRVLGNKQYRKIIDKWINEDERLN